MPPSATPARPEPPRRRKRGFETAAALLSRELKAPAEKRGFGEAKLLTHWSEIVGADLAAIARPVKITYGRGFGGTLVVLTTGAHAPVLEMQKDRIVERVNGCYGYRAVAHVHITQTAPTGFAEGQVAFGPPPQRPAAKPDPDRLARLMSRIETIEDGPLKQALARLAENVLTPRKS